MYRMKLYHRQFRNKSLAKSLMQNFPAFLLILFILLFTAMPVQAAGTVAISLSASSGQVRPGDTVTITGKVNASAAVATFDLSVSYNAGQLQYVKAEGLSPAIRSGELDTKPSSGSIQLLYLDGDGGGSGITSGNAFRITFKVIGGNVGDKINVGIQIRTVGDASAAAMTATGSGTSMTLAAPLSDNALLSSLAVDNGTLSPAFAKNTTSYTLAVPFTVEKINVTAKAEDAAAKISVSSPALAAGGATAVTVTVTAASGAKKTYTIQVTRAADPNYKPSANNSLVSLAIAPAPLSPAFTADRTEYIVYVPFEVEQLTVTAAPADGKASVTVEGNEAFKVGSDNLVKINCVAEDGSIKTYSLAVCRAAEFSGLASLTPTPAPSETTGTTSETTTAPQTTEAASPTPGPARDAGSGNTLAVILVLVLLLVIGETAYIIYLKR